ncbi:MAG: hypothetical protein NTV63_03230 [Candidatus Woesearchaeota archaeon]|nr:hypothetical protein [Candidatus Woesearchaeota archaeon]
MIKEFDYNHYDYRTLEEHLKGKGYIEEYPGVGDDFLCEEQHIFLEEAKRCSLKYLGINGNIVQYEIEREPERIPMLRFEKCIADSLRAFVLSEATKRTVKALYDKGEKTRERTSRSIGNIEKILDEIERKSKRVKESGLLEVSDCEEE